MLSCLPASAPVAAGISMSDTDRARPLVAASRERLPQFGWEDVAAAGRFVEPDLHFSALQEVSDRSDLRLRVDEVGSITRHEFLDDAAQRLGCELVRGNPDA